MSEKSRNKKFIQDIFIYGIGNIGSRILTFLLAPLYTYYINAADFGYYDLVLNVSFLAIPIVSLQLKESGFRFLLESKEHNIVKKIISTIYKLFFISSVTTSILLIIFFHFFEIRCSYLILINLIIFCLYEVHIQLIRGLGNNKLFITSGIITSLGIVLFSLLFVVYLKLGINGIFLSNILARCLTLVFIEARNKTWKFFSMKLKDRSLKYSLLKYSLPLLPNVICWWLISCSDRFFILHYLGITENGIYAITTKFITALQLFTTIIFQAWQETSIVQYKSKDKDSFFSSIFNLYSISLIALSIIFIIILKLNYSWLVEKQYVVSLQYIYPLTIVVILCAFSNFFEMGYQCSKQTKKILPSIGIAALINIICNFILIPKIGLLGVIYSGILTYLFLTMYRYIDTKKYFKIKLNKRLLVLPFLYASGYFFFYYIESVWLQIIYLTLISYISISFIIKLSIQQHIIKKILQKININLNI